MKKISLYLDEQLWHRFRIECVKRKTSASQVVAGLLDQQLQQWQLEDETRAAPSGECGTNPWAVQR
jgi:ParG